VLPADALTGHTMDDQAETLLIRLLRGSGTTGLASMRRGEQRPLLGLRRADTEAVCAELGIEPVRDPTNDERELWRSRVRHELVPLASDIASRDVVPILARTAELLDDDDRVLQHLGDEIDPTDARALAQAEPVVARRALRTWLTDGDGYPPDAASIERVLGVARGDAIACELPGGRRIERSGQRFRIVPRAE
jgi:tRNA(Ile)-lysidine synthase